MEKMREEFEREVIKRMNESGFSEIEVRVEMLGVSKCGVYHDGTVSCWWDFWKASRAALHVTLPMEYKDQFNELSYSSPAVRQALDAAGIRYV